MYRSEAAGIPTLLVAPKTAPEEGQEADRSIYDDGLGDSRGFYSDGAYTAAPILGPNHPTTSFSGSSTRDPQAVYFDKILERFTKLRSQLSNTPPRHVVESLDRDHSSFMSASAEDYRRWRWRIANTEPKSAQLAGMDKATLLRLLRLVVNDKHALGGKGVITGRTSRWVWGLLARLPERGEMNSEEIGMVRELGKRAVWLGVEMRGVDTSELDDGYGDEDDDEEEVLNVEVEEGEIDGNVAEVITQTGAQEPRIIGPILPQEAPKGRANFYDDPITEEEQRQDEAAAEAVDGCFWGDTPEHVRTQFSSDVGLNDLPVQYDSHWPNPEIFHILRNDSGDQTAEELAAASERLRNFFKRNQGSTRQLFDFVYKRNPAAEQYDGPVPPNGLVKAFVNEGGKFSAEDVAEATKTFQTILTTNPEYRRALFGDDPQPNGEYHRDSADDEVEEKAFERAWLVAGLAEPQTRVYDRGQDEVEEMALAQLGLKAGKNTLPVAEEEKTQDEPSQLAVARQRLLSQLDDIKASKDAESAEAANAERHATENEEAVAELQNARATIDMIITVAGEVYGQRDLLEFRETWD